MNIKPPGQCCMVLPFFSVHSSLFFSYFDGSTTRLVLCFILSFFLVVLPVADSDIPF